MVLALGVRLLVAAQTAQVPTVRHLIGDAAGYRGWAQRIAAGDWLGSESFYQAPLYPYVLGVWFRAAGDSVFGIRVLQALWGTSACALMVVAAGRMFGRRFGVVAGVLLALYGPSVFFDGVVQKASLDQFLVCVLLAVLVAAERLRSAASIAVLGGVVSLLALTRENAMVWHPVVALWVALGNRREQGTQSVAAGGLRKANGEEVGPATGGGHRLLRLGAYLLGAAVVLLPVGLRNARVGGEFALTTFQAGPNFYIGNHRGADGRYQPLVRGHESPVFERSDATELAQWESGRVLTPREVSRFWMRKAWDEIRADPAAGLKRTAYKLALTWNRYEISDVESLRVYRDAAPALNVLCAVGHFGVLAPLALLGMVATCGERRRWWVHYAMIATMTLAVAAFYVLGRYRFPLVPLLVPFASAGCVELWDSLRARNGARFARAIAVALATALAINQPIQDERRLDALAVMNAGVALAESGDVAGATPLFRDAVRVHPQSAEANNNLAQALALQGMFVEAVEHYHAALRLAPSLPGAAYNLGVALERVGRREEAKAAFHAALANDPDDQEARLALKRLGEG